MWSLFNSLKIKRYQILERLHTTNKICVYKAFDNDNKKEVVIKDFYDKNEARLESNNLKRVFNIPCCQKIRDEFLSLKSNYLVTDYYKNGTLLDYLIENDKIENNKNIEKIKYKMLVFRLLRPLYNLHQYNYAHLDIKPDNFVLHDEFQIYSKLYKNDFYLIDFYSLSKANQELREHDNIDFKYFTSSYLAPETKTKKQFNINTDMWGFGLITYNILFREQFIFNLEDEVETYNGINEIKNDFFKKGNELGLSENFVSLLTNCFNLDARERTSSEELFKFLINNK